MDCLSYPREPDAAYRVRQHVAENRRKRISGWEIRMESRMLPMRDLKEIHLSSSGSELSAKEDSKRDRII